MSRRGEQGEHFGRFRVLSPRVWAKDQRLAPLLTLLTRSVWSPLSRRQQRGGLV